MKNLTYFLMRTSSKIAFVNQSTGLLFKGLAESLSMEWFPSVLYTGDGLGLSTNPPNGKLAVKVLNSYDRNQERNQVMNQHLLDLVISIN